MSDNDEASVELGTLMSDLQHPGKRFAEASRKVTSLPPADLLRLLTLERRSFHQRRRMAFVVSISLGMAVFLGASLIGNRGAHPMLCIYGGMGLWFLLMGRHLRARGVLIQAIEQAEDVRFVPLALDMLSKANNAVPKAIAQLLIRLLPTLRPGQTDDWTPQQKQRLLLLIKPPFTNVELTLAALKALAQVGDESASDPVTQLCEMQHEKPLLYEDVTKLIRRPGLSKEAQKIQEAARQCLPFLQIRAAERKQMQTLLRPAGLTDTPEVLLRPAVARGERSSEQLLRIVERTTENASE